MLTVLPQKTVQNFSHLIYFLIKFQTIQVLKHNRGRATVINLLVVNYLINYHLF